MKNKCLLSLILFFNIYGDNSIQISFKKLFPKTEIEESYIVLLKISDLINCQNIFEGNKNLFENLIFDYLIMLHYLIMQAKKNEKKIVFDDLMFLVKLINKLQYNFRNFAKTKKLFFLLDNAKKKIINLTMHSLLLNKCQP